MDKISLMIPDSLLTETKNWEVFLDRIQELGINGVEILFTEGNGCYEDTAALENFSDELLKRKMRVPCVDLYADYLRGGLFAQACAVVDRMIDAAAILGSPLGMACGSVLPEEMEPGKGREVVAKGIDRAIKTGRKKKVAIAIESFGISYHLQSRAEMLADLYSKLTEGPCFLVGDLGNPCYGGESPIISLQRFFEKLKHVHVKDVKKTKPGKGFPTANDYWLDVEKLGMGIANVPDSIRFLRQKHYAGWYSLELNWRNNPSMIRQYSATLKRLLKTG